METVADSSRYFVIRIQDGTGELGANVSAKGWGWRRPRWSWGCARRMKMVLGMLKRSGGVPGGV